LRQLLLTKDTSRHARRSDCSRVALNLKRSGLKRKAVDGFGPKSDGGHGEMAIFEANVVQGTEHESLISFMSKMKF
jgi:hypothetical protein